MSKLVRRDIARNLKPLLGLTVEQCLVCVDSVYEQIAEALRRGDQVELHGFGVFELKEYPAYIGVNPKNRTPVNVPAKARPVVKFTPALREEIQTAYTERLKAAQVTQ